MITKQGDMKAYNNSPCVSGVNFDSLILSPSEETKLLNLLSEYLDIFATMGTLSAQTTVVKHSIKTTGPYKTATLENNSDPEGQQ